MANIGAVTAHLIKFIVTLACMRFFRDSYSLRVVEEGWAVRAYQLSFVHSILGIIRFGCSITTKRFRDFYDKFSCIIDVAPAAFFTTEILLKLGLCDEMRYLVLAIGILPAAVELSSSNKNNRMIMERFTNFTYALQLLVLLMICENNHSYGGVSLAASIALSRFFSHDFCDQYEIPYNDLFQYSQSFIEFFALIALKDH